MMAATTNAAATNVLRLSDSRAFLTKSLALDAGTQHYAPNPVAAKVSVVNVYLYHWGVFLCPDSSIPTIGQSVSQLVTATLDHDHDHDH